MPVQRVFYRLVDYTGFVKLETDDLLIGDIKNAIRGENKDILASVPSRNIDVYTSKNNQVSADKLSDGDEWEESMGGDKFHPLIVEVKASPIPVGTSSFCSS
jgi:hypothetical protein